MLSQAGMLSVCVLGVLACQTVDPTEFEPVPLEVAEPVEFKVPHSAGSHLGGEADFAREAIEEFRESGVAPVIRRPGFVLWPFGETFPVLYCKPLRVCDIELQAGETVAAVIFGDTTRWIGELADGRVGEESVSHLLLKPREYGISTNLVILTDRRTYHIGLMARKDERGEYVRSARFYYPRETVVAWNRSVREEDEGFLGRLFPGRVAEVADPEALNFSYEISVSGKKSPSWEPVAVFDDGARTFIQFPSAVAPNGGAAAPVLFLKNGKKRELRNYRVQGSQYVVDGVFDHALLVHDGITVQIERESRQVGRPSKNRRRVKGMRR